MSILPFRRFSAESQLRPIDVATTPDNSVAQRVIRTVESLRLDPSEIVIVGSAALTLYGIMPPPQHVDDIRPHDVDLATTYAIATELYATGSIAGKYPLQLKDTKHFTKQTILRVDTQLYDEQLLPVDIITRFDPKKFTPTQFDEGFREHFDKHSIPIPGTDSGLRVAAPELIHRELRQPSTIDVKQSDDLRVLQNAIRSAKK